MDDESGESMEPMKEVPLIQKVWPMRVFLWDNAGALSFITNITNFNESFFSIIYDARIRFI